MRRKYTLNELSQVGPSFWLDKSIHELYYYFNDAFARASARQWSSVPNMQAILESMARRLFELTNEDTMSSIYYFVLDAQSRGGISRGVLGEKYLYLSAIVNYHIGSYEAAAHCASILHDVYELNMPRNERRSSYFRMIATDSFAKLMMGEALAYHQQLARPQAQTLEHLINNMASSLRTHLNDQSYFVQSTAVISLYKSLKSINISVTVAGNHMSFFEAPTLENSLVEATVVLRFLNENFFRELSHKDANALLRLDALFSENSFNLCEQLIRYQPVWEARPEEVVNALSAYVQQGLARGQAAGVRYDF